MRVLPATAILLRLSVVWEGEFVSVLAGAVAVAAFAGAVAVPALAGAVVASELAGAALAGAVAVLAPAGAADDIAKSKATSSGKPPVMGAAPNPLKQDITAT
jgi:hypothetical protein